MNLGFDDSPTIKVTIMNFSLYIGGLSIYGIYFFTDLPSGVCQIAISLMLFLLLCAFPKRQTRLAYIFVIPAFIIHHGLLFVMQSMPAINWEHFTTIIFFSGVLYAPVLPGIFLPIIAAASLSFYFLINQTESFIAVTVGKMLGTILLAVLMARYARAIRSITMERDQFYHTSIIDSLTGLYSFSHIVEVGQQLLSAGKELIVIFFDLDNFKNINDTYGHLVGNQVLHQFAQNLSEVAGENTVSGRMGGDELVLLLIKETKMQKSVNEILEELSNKSYIPDPKLIPIYLSFSYGIAESEVTATSNIEELLSLADKAIYCNKFSQPTSFYNCTNEIGITGRFRELFKVLSQKDMYTYVHSLNVAQYSTLLAKKIGLNSADVENLRLAGYLHDIGKLVVPNEILRKPSRLDDDEYKTIKYHVKDGINLLQATDINDIVLNAIAYHHEHYDGRGYPYGYSGTNIPLAGRILAIADTYSAMTVKRLYRHQSTQEEALHELTLNKGSQFDPELVDQFVALFR
ncbi:MAG: diguanylate cyclase and metal dependent phosphohydrolase [Firmicutes bacterium]|nr:diguanylate cyclase and metal dependent phosphohydrolase [Bacillota bacterium]